VEGGCPPPLALENGRYEPVKDEYAGRDKVAYTCDSGYYVRDESKQHVFEFECQFVNRWSALVDGQRQMPDPDTFSRLPKCTAFVPCPRPSLNFDIIIDVDKDSYNATEIIEFQCRDSALYPNDAESRFVSSICLNGEWSVPVPSGCYRPVICGLDPPSLYMQHEPAVHELLRGKSVTYVCKQGYQISLEDPEDYYENESDYDYEDKSQKNDFRHYTRTCGADGQMSGRKPTCKKFTCKRSLISIEHGTVYFHGNTTDSLAGDAVHYRCPSNYRLVGDNVQYCELNNGWVGDKPWCGLKYCVTPRLYHGTVEPNKNTFGPDETVKFSCFNQYTLIGPPTLTCGHNNEWDSQAVPVCHPSVSNTGNLCMDQGIPHNGYRLVRYFPNRVLIKYGCDPTFTRVGNQFLDCWENKGEWNGVIPICKSKYSFPKPEKEALRLLSRITEIVTATSNQGTSTPSPDNDPSSQDDDQITQNPTVLYVLMDQSASLSNFSMDSTVYFLNPVLKELMAMASKPKVGIIGFTGTPEWLLTPSDDVDNVTKVMDRITTKKGGTNFVSALRSISALDEEGETPQAPQGEIEVRMGEADEDTLGKPARKDDRKKIILLVSDGQYNMGGDPTSDARELQAAGYNMLLLAKGVTTLSPVMRSLASNPLTDTFFLHEHAFIDNSFKLSLDNDFLPCGFNSPSNKDPWIAEIRWNGEQSVQGFIVGSKWVLALLSPSQREGVSNRTHFTVDYDKEFIRTVNVKTMNTWPGKQIVLFMLEDPLHFGPNARAICLSGGLLDPTNGNGMGFGLHDPRHLTSKAGFLGRVVTMTDSRPEKIVRCQDSENRDHSLFCTKAGAEEDNREVAVNDDPFKGLKPERHSYLPQEPRRRGRRDVMEMFELKGGEAFVGEGPNRWDLRDRRNVLTGLYSAQEKAFVLTASLQNKFVKLTMKNQGRN